MTTFSNTLSARLKKLEEAWMLSCKMYSTHPPRAEYELTEKGRALGAVMDALYDWGMAQTPDITTKGSFSRM